MVHALMLPFPIIVAIVVGVVVVALAIDVCRDEAFQPARARWRRRIRQARWMAEGLGVLTAVYVLHQVIGFIVREDVTHLPAAATAPPSPTPLDGLVGLLSHNPPPMLTIALPVLTMIAVLLWVAGMTLGQQPRGQSKGLASRRQLHQNMSRRAVRRKAPVTRPSTAPLTRSQLRRLPVTQYAVHLGRATTAWGLDLFMTFEDLLLLIAPPRAGKTAWIAGRVIDAPGAVVATSTKPDLYRLTEGLRRAKGRVWVFNPEQLGAIASTFRWSPVAGCEDPETAIERAGYLLAGAPLADGVTNRSYWEGAAFETLKAYLHAAALGGLSMGHVWAWASNPGDLTAVKILGSHERAAQGWAEKLAQTLKLAPVTRDSIFSTLNLALGFMSNPQIAATMQTRPGEAFDIDVFVSSADTLYLIGAHKEKGSLAPLFTAFTGALFERAKFLASHQAGGRLDPPVLFALDEAALICPVPLERWTADAGGRAIPLLIAVQSLSQLYARYGTYAGKAIFDTCNIKMVLGGLSVVEDLEDFSRLAGEAERERESVSTAPGGGISRHKTRVRERVLTPEQIRMLPERRALIIHRASPAILVDYVPVWDRPDVKRHHKATTAKADSVIAPRTEAILNVQDAPR